MEQSQIKIVSRPKAWIMREEIVLEANSKKVLATLRKRLLPFTQQTVRIFGGDVSVKVYYLKPPILKGSTLSVEGVPFLIMGDIRRPNPAEEVFRFEVAEVDDTRTKVCGECKQTVKALEDIFERVWSGIIQL
jgi:hypothetical protein